MVYLDKNTPILVQYADNKSFQKAKAVSKKSRTSSCLRNVLIMEEAIRLIHILKHIY